MYPHLANAYYSDTDSIFIDYLLNKDLIGHEIGLFKQEYGGRIKKALFPASKLYFLHQNFIFLTLVKELLVNLKDIVEIYFNLIILHCTRVILLKFQTHDDIQIFSIKL